MGIRGSYKLEVQRNIVGQMPMFIPPCVWTPTPVSKLPSWAGAKRVAIDVETKDPHLTTLGPGVRRDGEIVGVSFYIEDHGGYYLPVAHPEDNLDAEHVFNYVRDQAREFTGDIVGANLSYDLDYLFEYGVSFPKIKRYKDVQIYDPLIDEMQMSYSLENIAHRYELPGKDETLLREAAHCYYVDPKKGLWQLPGRFAAQYAIFDTELPLKILRKQDKIVEERNLSQIVDVESRLLPVLVNMRRRGVAIDVKKLQAIEDWTFAEQRKAHAAIREISGVTLSIDDVNKASAIARTLLMYDSSIQIGTTAKGQPNIDIKFLKSLKSPLADAIQRSKKLDKLRNTFAASIRRYMIKGRIHATFRQLVGTANDSDSEEKGVRFGRLSMTDPNLQQQPSKDEDYDGKKENNLLTDDDFHMGKLWRSIYIPDEGHWAAMDYSGQEPRMIVHYAGAAKCQGGMEMVNAYLANPKLDLHKMTADLAGIKRKPAKIIFLGLAYGMGGAKLCHSLGLPTIFVHSPKFQKMVEMAGPEGKALLDRYNTMVPFLKDLRQKCEKRAGQRGYITTILGRQLHFPLKKDFKTGQPTGGYDYLHKALNRLVQGSAADQTKLAVVTAAEAGEHLQLQVHDEIDTTVRDRAHAEKIADIMRTCVPLLVPSLVDVELGDSWGASMG